MNGQSLSPDYALLQIGDLRLAFSQADVSVIGLSSDVDGELQQGHDCGVLVNKDGRWPVFSLTDSLMPLLQLARNRRFCVCFGSGADEKAFALGCDSVESFSVAEHSRVQELPECMETPNTPVRQLVVDEGKLIFLSGAADMYAYLAGLED